MKLTTYVLNLSGNPATWLVRSGGGRVYRAFGQGDTADRYLMLFDALTAPVNGTQPLAEAVVQASFAWDVSFEPGGIQCNTGIFIAFSSTPKTYTSLANATVSTYVQAVP
jgi:hypothetical protein